MCRVKGYLAHGLRVLVVVGFDGQDVVGVGVCHHTPRRVGQLEGLLVEQVAQFLHRDDAKGVAADGDDTFAALLGLKVIYRIFILFLFYFIFLDNIFRLPESWRRNPATRS